MQYTVINIILYQILGKRESQTRQVFDFAGTKFRENSQKISKIAKSAKFNTFKELKIEFMNMR